MANAIPDKNRVKTILAVSKVDKTTPVVIAVNPVTNAVIVEIV